MSNDRQLLENIMTQANQLSPEYRLRLIQLVTETLLPPPPQDSKSLEFGKYKSNRMSTLEDFALVDSSLPALMDKLSDNAQAQGLTAEKLEILLSDD